jgi:hypothetical protein
MSVQLEFLNGANQGITFQVPAETVTRCEQPRKSARHSDGSSSSSSSSSSSRAFITAPAIPRFSGLRTDNSTNTQLDYSLKNPEMFKLAQSESLDELRRLWADPALFFPSWCGVALTPIKDVKMGLWFSQPFKANFYTELPNTVRTTLAKEAVTVGHPCPYEQATDNPLPVFPLVFTCPSCKDKNEHTYDVLDMDTHVCGVCAGKCQLPVVDFFSHGLFFFGQCDIDGCFFFFLSFFPLFRATNMSRVQL